MVWHDWYSMGVELIDDEHREILDQLDELVASENSAFAAQLLLGYVSKHFADEERVMANIGFKGLGRHKKLHDDFRVRVVEMVRRIDEPGMVDRLVKYSSDWIVAHIANEDVLIGVAVKEFVDSVFEGIGIDPKYLGE